MFRKIKNLFFLLIFICISGLLVLRLYNNHLVLRVPEDAAALKHWREPIQNMLPGTHGVKFQYGQVRFIAEFEISGRILGKKYYDDGRYAQIAPMDLAVGWKRLSKPVVYEQSKMHSHNRVFTWESTLPIPREEVIRSFANLHIIPRDEEVWKKLVALEKGQLVTLQGYLVNYDEIKNNRTFMLRTSLVRTDEGFDACELLYVTSVRPYAG